MRKAAVTILAILFFVAFSSSLFAVQKEPSGDKKFAQKAAAGGMFEVEAGKLAAQKASNEDVKKFGQRMVDDHQKANDELMKIATDKGIKIDKKLDKKHQGKVDKLGKASGADFDTQYIDMMVKDHEMDIKEFSKEADSGKDPELKAFASKTLPTLKEHLNMAKETQSKIKAASGKEGTGKAQPTTPSK